LKRGQFFRYATTVCQKLCVGADESSKLKLADILTFWTGADCVPLGGFPDPLQIEFYSKAGNDRRLPSASTCACTLWLPRNVSEPDSMWELLEDAINLSGGYGKI